MGQFTLSSPHPAASLLLCTHPHPVHLCSVHARGAAAGSEQENRVRFNVALSATPGITFLLPAPVSQSAAQPDAPIPPALLQGQKPSTPKQTLGCLWKDDLCLASQEIRSRSSPRISLPASCFVPCLHFLAGSAGSGAGFPWQAAVRSCRVSGTHNTAGGRQGRRGSSAAEVAPRGAAGNATGAINNEERQATHCRMQAHTWGSCCIPLCSMWN